MRRSILLLACALLGACALHRGERVETLGQVHEDDLPGPGSWLLAATPSIVAFDISRRIEADADTALSHYEAVAETGAGGDGRHEALRRAAALRLQLADDNPDPLLLRRAVEDYRQLLAESPQDPNRDQLLYQLARSWQSLGERAEAGEVLRRLLGEYPDSPLAGDAAFRLAELDFAGKRYEAAATSYSRVLADGPDSRFFAMAQYKLGWTAFRLGRFDHAIEQFLALLARELPDSPAHEPAAVLAAAAPGRAPWIADALRVISLSLAAQGGAGAWSRHFPSPSQEPPFAPLLYTALGELMLEKRHYTAAAAAFAAYGQRHPGADLAPAFARRQIDSLDAGGFTEAMIRATVDFVDTYAPDAPWWQGRDPQAELSARWQADLDMLAAHFHARAQRAEATGRPSARQDYLKAARWYQRRLALLPQDPAAAETEFLLAEALEAAGLPEQAVSHFERTAYAYPDFARAGDAAYAALLLRFGQDDGASPAALAAAERLLASFPQHSQWQAVSLRRLDVLLARQDWDAASAQAQALLARAELQGEVRHRVLAVAADAHFALARYAAAEQAYAQLIAVAPPTPALRDNLALSIYRQGEQARENGDAGAAAAHFLRVGRLVPAAAIRDEADFDAAAALLAQQDLAGALPLLQGLLSRSAAHPLAPEARRKLATVHERLGQPVLAAGVYRAIAEEKDGDAATAREAMWRAARLYDEAGEAGPAAAVYARYLELPAGPLMLALRARQRLAELSAAADPTGARRWLASLVETESAAGAQRSAASRQLAARAALDLGRQAVDRAGGIMLRVPLERSLQARRALLQEALDWLGRVGHAGFAETVPAASFAAARAYADLARALLNVPAPRGLDALEQEEFRFLLEEQAFGLEELAIQWHERNLDHLGQGVWDRWVAASAQALGELVPARYAKTEQLETSYATLD